MSQLQSHPSHAVRHAPLRSTACPFHRALIGACDRMACPIPGLTQARAAHTPARQDRHRVADHADDRGAVRALRRAQQPHLRCDRRALDPGVPGQLPVQAHHHRGLLSVRLIWLLRLFFRFTCPAMTVVTVILRALDVFVTGHLACLDLFPPVLRVELKPATVGGAQILI